MNQVRIQPSAETDANNAANWYESQQFGLGIEFMLELDAAIERAGEMPEAYAELYQNVRRVLVRRFPYPVYFVLGSGVVEIFAILHQHQNPETWQSRVR